MSSSSAKKKTLGDVVGNEKESSTPKRPKKDDETTTESSPPPPLPPFDSTKYVWPKMQMEQLRSDWNLLDQCPYSGVYQGTEERKGYLMDMSQILRNGHAEYQNPFGADDREEFADSFCELNKSEQKSFFQAISTSIRQRRPLSAADIEAIFAHPPEPPYQISLKRSSGSSSSSNSTDSTPAPYQDGSERFPFESVDAAVSRLTELPRQEQQGREEFTLKLVHCAPDCRDQECYHRNCKRRICLEHGHGEGWATVDGDVVFRIDKCIDCGNIACQRHGFDECDVCSNSARGEMQLGMCDDDCADDSFHVCSDCMRVCQRIVQNEEEESEEEDEEPRICGFKCCKSCFDDHKCGDDPSEYC